MKAYRLLGIIFLLSMSQSVFSGFVAGTLVKVPDGYEAIENLVPGSMVYSCDEQGDIHISKISNTFSYTLPKAIIFESQDDVIITAPFQKYYILGSNSWHDAAKVSIDTKLCSLNKEQVNIQNISKLDSKVELFDIQLEDVHTFCVTKQDIVVHNFPPFAVGLGFAFGGGITFEGIKVGLCIAGVWIGTKVLKRQRDGADSDVEIMVSCTADPDQLYLDDYSYFNKSVEDILNEAMPGQKTKGKVKQYVKPGGYEDAIKDFKGLAPANIKKMEGKEGWVGILPDGRKVNVRVDSTCKKPTLEIQQPGNKGKVIKIRYEDK